MCVTARAKNASAAKIATSSRHILWLVGFPRRRLSSSIQGRSSWISDDAWIISTAQAAGIAVDSWPPTSSQAARQSTGLTRLPLESREYLIASRILCANGLVLGSAEWNGVV